MSTNENHIVGAASAPTSLRDGGSLSAGTSDLLVNQLHSGYSLLYLVFCRQDSGTFTLLYITLKKKK